MPIDEMGPTVGHPQRGGVPGCIIRPGSGLRDGDGAIGTQELCLTGWAQGFAFLSEIGQSLDWQFVEKALRASVRLLSSLFLLRKN